MPQPGPRSAVRCSPGHRPHWSVYPSWGCCRIRVLIAAAASQAIPYLRALVLKCGVAPNPGGEGGLRLGALREWGCHISAQPAWR